VGGEVRVIAEQIIDRLGRRGYLEFGELLSQDSGNGFHMEVG